MTLAKATVTGTVYRAPEKRFTQNDIAVYGLTLNIDEREETLVRVVSKRRNLSDILDGIKKGDKILVDGHLQVASSKAQDGSERRFFEIDANEIELLSGTGSVAQAPTSSEEIVTFGEFEAVDEPEIADDNLIDEEEIPF